MLNQIINNPWLIALIVVIIGLLIGHVIPMLFKRFWIAFWSIPISMFSTVILNNANTLLIQYQSSKRFEGKSMDEIIKEMRNESQK